MQFRKTLLYIICTNLAYYNGKNYTFTFVVANIISTFYLSHVLMFHVTGTLISYHKPPILNHTSNITHNFFSRKQTFYKILLFPKYIVNSIFQQCRNILVLSIFHKPFPCIKNKAISKEL